MTKCSLCGENNSDAHCDRTDRDVHTQCLIYCYADMQTYGYPITEETDEVIDMARSILGV